MSDYCTHPDSRTIKIERVLPGPIERVWSYLTDSEKRGKWFCAGEMDLKPGGHFEMKFDNSKLSDNEQVPEKYKKYEEGVTYKGTISKCEPPNLLVFLWHEEKGEDSEVTFALAATGDDILLTLTHRKLAHRGEVVGASGGWHAHLDILVDHLKGDKSRGFWNNFTRLEAEYEQRIPKE